MAEPPQSHPARRHVIIVQLNEGYTVSMGDQIVACETLERVLMSVQTMLQPYEGVLPPPLSIVSIRPDIEPLPAISGTVFDIEAPPAPPRPPTPPPNEDPPYDPEIDTLPEDLRPFPDENHEVTVPATASIEEHNLQGLIAAYQEGTIDVEEFHDGVRRYCPSYTEEQVSFALMQAQGLDPVRFANGRPS